MTVSDNEVNDHCSKLMDASLQLLSTVKAMEAQLAKQKQRPPSQQEQPQQQQQQPQAAEQQQQDQPQRQSSVDNNSAL